MAGPRRPDSRMNKPQQTTPELKATSAPAPAPVDPPPLTHQPLVAVSVVLIVATVAQITVYLVNARLIAQAVETVLVLPSSLVANGLAFDGLSVLVERLNASDVPDSRLIFSVLLVLSILSTVCWYFVARQLLGAAWAPWTAALWALHPLFAFLAQRPSPLTLCLFCVPLAWGLILWWHRSRRRRVAFLAGFVAGLSTLASLAVGVAFVLCTPLLFATGRLDRRPAQSFMLIWIGFAIPLLVAWYLVTQAVIAPPFGAFSRDLIRVIEAGQSPLSRPMSSRVSRTSGTQSVDSLQIVGYDILDSPGPWGQWLAGRAWRTLAATADGKFQRPLFAAQMTVVVPAIWGAVVCLGQSRWRWPAVAGILLLVVHWIIAAIAEPLARGLAPVGGILVLFAVVGIADIYERAFGRHLEV